MDAVEANQKVMDMLEDARYLKDEGYTTKDSGEPTDRGEYIGDVMDREANVAWYAANMVDGEYVTKDSGEREQYASGMQRDVTTGKTKWHLVTSGPMLKRWAELMTRGAEKYDDDNWMKANSVVEYLRFKASAMRHFMQWFFGDTDEDHAAAVIFNINGAEYVNDMMTEQWNEDY